jgi:hypothetical protein
VECADLVEKLCDLNFMGALGLLELIHDLVKFKGNLHGLGLIFPSEQFEIESEVIDHFTEGSILIQKL